MFPRARSLGKLLMPLYGVDMRSDGAHDRRRVARAGSYFEYFVAGTNLGELNHARDNVRLRDCLPGLDGKRGIFVGKFTERRRHERLTRNFAHGSEHVWIHDTARLEMAGDHKGTVAGVDIGSVRPVLGNTHDEAKRYTYPADPSLIGISSWDGVPRRRTGRQAIRLGR